MDTSTPNPLLTTPALELVAAELRRVQLQLGYSPARDDQYTKGELTDAAVAYLVAPQVREQLKIAFEPGAPSAETVAKVCHWPWPIDTFKPAADDSTEGRIRELVKAVSLAVSEIGRLQRAEGVTMQWESVPPFDLIAHVDGDMGTWVFRRLPDMFEFFRTDSGRINPGYWAEKLTAMPEGGYAEISQDLVKGLIWRTALHGLRHARSLGADWSDVREAIAEFKQLRARCEESDPVGAMCEFKSDVPLIHRPTTYSITFPEPWDHTLHEYRHGYLWILYAIVWGIQQYDAHVDEALKKPAEVGV